MEEVFMNLMNNARDAMPEGGIIEITTSLEKDSMRIDFKDRGCGMSEEVMKRIFEPFFTTKEKGTGLGLSVCYGIIKAHNGELKFESEPGKGTTVTILLPLKETKDNV
jgi:signal transduction histidine kinase